MMLNEIKIDFKIMDATSYMNRFEVEAGDLLSYALTLEQIHNQLTKFDPSLKRKKEPERGFAVWCKPCYSPLVFVGDWDDARKSTFECEHKCAVHKWTVAQVERFGSKELTGFYTVLDDYERSITKLDTGRAGSNAYTYMRPATDAETKAYNLGHLKFLRERAKQKRSRP